MALDLHTMPSTIYEVTDSKCLLLVIFYGLVILEGTQSQGN